LEDATELGDQALLSDLQRIHTAAQRFLGLLNDVVNFAQIETGEIAPELVTTPTEDMMQTVVTTIHTLESNSHEIVSSIQGHILVVDDNEMNRDVLCRRLARQGHTVAAAANGRQALAMIGSQQFDLVLLDVIMPEMNGYQTLHYLKTTAEFRDIPVIMISALDELDSVVRCIEIGAEDYLPKLFNPVLLNARIGVCLGKKRLRDQEVEYLRNVAQVAMAAAAVEVNDFNPASLDPVALRSDELGQLARVFQRMAREVHTREQRLRQQVAALHIEIDEVKKTKQVTEITESDFFLDLQQKAQRLRSRREG
jgi:DNA-binding response OmpR family regulator